MEISSFEFSESTVELEKWIKIKGKKVKERIAVNGTPISQLWNVTCHMGSHSVTCYPTQVNGLNAPRLNPSQ